MVEDADDRLIVAGAGFAGLIAGISAIESGASVTIVEKAPEPGGTTVLSGGLLWTFSEYEKIREKIPLGDPALQWLVYDLFADGCEWLQRQGIKLGPAEAVMFHGTGRSFDPAQAIKILSERFLGMGGELLMETALEKLAFADGAISGLDLLQGATIGRRSAGAVVLATGGFQGNSELLSRYVVRSPDNLALRANGWSTGDGFRAALAAGARASRGLETFYGHALAAPPAKYTREQLRDMSQYFGLLSVAINMDGRRFADETEGTGEEILNQQLAHQRGGRGFYIVDDDAMMLTPIEGRPGIVKTMLDRARAAGGTVIEAHSIEDLAFQLGQHGVPEKRALATLRDFNRCMQEGDGCELDPPRARHRKPLLQPPFRAVAVKAGISFTMGGLQIDEHGRVLRDAGTTTSLLDAPPDRAFREDDAATIRIGNGYKQTVIPGLYAAGCDVGNISHFGYIGSLATALTTARAAGRHAAKWIQERQHGA